MALLTRLKTDQRRIVYGLMEGQGWMAEDFDGPLPYEIQAGFEGRR